MRYCPTCTGETETFTERIPPAIVVTCATCGTVLHVRSLPDKVHTPERADPTPVFEPAPTPESSSPASPANTCTPSPADDRAPHSSAEPEPLGNKVHPR